jgi:uncharacterized protein (DUF58 family)
MPDSHPPTPRRRLHTLHDWATRNQTSSTTHTLVQRKLYVLPTKAGVMLGITLLVLLIASINFQLNLGYALTFLIAGSALSSLWWGYRNVYGLQLRLGALKPTFQGQRMTVPVLLDNASGQRHRHGVSLAMHRSHGKLAWVHTDISATHTTTVELGSVPHQRGWHPLPRIVVESRFPLGVFRIWSYWQPDARVLVYPAPEIPAPPIHFADAQEADKAPAHNTGMAEHDGVRSYQRGDALRNIVWKKTATALATGSGDLVVRNGQQPQAPSLWLDARATGLVDPEVQIARLTAWVLQTHEKHWHWGLRLPSGLRIAPAAGTQHLQACLAALAVDGKPQQHLKKQSN